VGLQAQLIYERKWQAMVLRWGIIGAGEIAGRGMGPALNRAANTKFAAVCSRSMDKARAFAARYKVERAYDSLEKMLQDRELDAVYIATPNSLHAPQAILAAEAGKHVLCEKPMATTVRDAELMIEACNRNQVKLGVVYQNRYHPAHYEARKQIQSGTLGDIDLASAQMCRGFARGSHWSGWRIDPVMTGSGAIVAQAVHPIDLLRFLLESEVELVQAMTDESPPERPVEEMVYSVLRFRNGVHATVVAGTLIPRYDNDLLLYGAKAKIVCKGTLGVPLNNRTGEITVEGDSVDVRMSFPPSSVQDKMVRLVEDFNQSVAGNTELGVSGYNGLQMVRIATALQDSSRRGRAVEIG
jgi:1,5-anhydro-D-fructose reductase (1,5-anhydro-D-mannitol-forming)